MDHDRATEAGLGAIGRMGRPAQCVDPAAEERYWQEHHAQRPYVPRGARWEDYGPAFRYGVDAYGRYGGRRFDEIESDLATGWATAREGSSLDWSDAKPAVRDAWRHAAEAIDRPGRGQAT